MNLENTISFLHPFLIERVDGFPIYFQMIVPIYQEMELFLVIPYFLTFVFLICLHQTEVAPLSVQ